VSLFLSSGASRKDARDAHISAGAGIQAPRIGSEEGAQGQVLGKVGVGLYTILPLPIVCGVWHAKGGSVRGRIFPNVRAIVLQSG